MKRFLLLSLTAGASAFVGSAPRPALALRSTPPDDGTFGSAPTFAADPEAEVAALEALAPAAPAVATDPQSYAEAEGLALERCSLASACIDEDEAARLYGEAADLFERALKLPGDDYDVRRVSTANSPVGGAAVLRGLESVTFASVLQRQTAHYNIACCRSKLGQSTEALDALETALSLGFDDFQLVQREGDFDVIRGDVDRLVARFKPKGLFADVSFPQPQGAPGGLADTEPLSLFGMEVPIPKLPNPFGGLDSQKPLGGASLPSLPSFGGGGEKKQGGNPLSGLVDGIKKGMDEASGFVDYKDDDQKPRRR